MTFQMRLIAKPEEIETAVNLAVTGSLGRPAINLKQHTVSSTGINACRDGKLQDASASSARQQSRKKTPDKHVLFG